MKKKLFFAAVAIVALASCSDNEFIGDNSPTTQQENAADEIQFGFDMQKITRADAKGYEAADLLGGKFVVEGTKGENGTTTIASTVVFDNYDVDWTANTAGTTESNSSDWEYVGLTKNGASSITGNQSIKYWDYSVPQYNFVAYSVGNGNTAIYSGDPGATQLLLSKIDPATGSYTVKGALAALKKFFVADMVTKNKANGDYNKVVEIKFRHLNSKIRMGLYETVPGYSVKDVKFYSSASGNSYDTPTPTIPTTTPTLYSSEESIFSGGTYTVTYPNVGTTPDVATDYNKAHVAISGQTGGTTQTFDALDYNNPKTIEGNPSLAEANYLGEASNTATYPTSSTNKDYTDVLPNEAEGVSLTLRVDYTLVSNDGSKETIVVKNASAVVPAIYCKWKPGYAYTYLFKISDKSNGITGSLATDPVGLYPITFDAVVLATEDFVQETVTTVATPSITTYQHDPASNAVVMNEYKAGAGPIYIIVDGKSDLNVYGQLYTVARTGTTDISEATVVDALNIEPTTSGSTTTGRNGIALTTASSDATIKTIVGPDGNNITVDAHSAASFTPASAATYAYVYKLTGGKAVALSAGDSQAGYYSDIMCATTPLTGTADAAKTVYQKSGNITTAVTVAASTVDNADGYYTDKDCKDAAAVSGGYLPAGTYYKKVTVNYATYAVKVIKVQ